MSKDNGYSPLTKLIGLWQNESKKGKTYFTGRIGDCKILLLPNPEWEEGGNLPTHNLCLSHSPKRQQQGDGQRQGDGSRQGGQRQGGQRQQRQGDATIDQPPPPDDSDRF